MKYTKFFTGGIVAVILLRFGIFLGAWSISDEEIFRKFWLSYAIEQPFWTQTWLGIHTLRFPFDAWMEPEIIYEQKPDFIVETGTYRGGSAVYYPTILQQVNPQGRIISIDIVDRIDRSKLPDGLRSGIQFLMGSSADPQIVDQVRETTRGKNVLVILDSNHTRDHVHRELQAYSPMIQVGGYVVVEDTFLNGHPPKFGSGPGPWEAVESFLQVNPQFEPDRYRERLGLTVCPNGYLKRMR